MAETGFWRDALAVAEARVRAGAIDRRALVAAAAVLAGAGLARGQPARPRELVLANWGGDAVRAMEQAFGEPFSATRGSAS